jgi:hypothetical protein
MIHVLDKEDKVWNKRASLRLDKWIKEFKKTSPKPHPFKIVGVGKLNRRIYDCFTRKN